MPIHRDLPTHHVNMTISEFFKKMQDLFELEEVLVMISALSTYMDLIRKDAQQVKNVSEVFDTAAGILSRFVCIMPQEMQKIITEEISTKTNIHLEINQVTIKNPLQFNNEEPACGLQGFGSYKPSTETH